MKIRARFSPILAFIVPKMLLASIISSLSFPGTGIEKYHIIPRQFVDDLKGLEDKQVKIAIGDEI